jgi:hypothetical protein
VERTLQLKKSQPWWFLMTMWWWIRPRKAAPVHMPCVVARRDVNSRTAYAWLKVHVSAFPYIGRDLPGLGDNGGREQCGRLRKAEKHDGMSDRNE